MLTQLAGQYRTLIAACGLALSASTLSAQHLLLSVQAKAGPQCGPAISSGLDQQGTEARLRAVGFQIAKARSATLYHEVECSVERKTVTVHQCLTLSEFVAAPSQSRAVQLTTRWRECKAYACYGTACAASVSSGLSELEGLFATTFGSRNDATVDPKPTRHEDERASETASSSLIRSIGHIPGPALYYICYILVCITVMFRWSLAGSHANR